MLGIGTIERIAVRVLPAPLVKQLQEIKHRLPLRLQQAPPVVQMFINDGSTRSLLGLHNIFSHALPEVASDVRAEITLYDPEGRRLFRHIEQLRHFGARAVDLSKLLEDRKRSSVPYGVVTVQLTPKYPRRASYRALGQFAAHFFVFFRDARGSVGQTHPLSTAGRQNIGGSFVSSQVISTAGIDEVVLWQYNPGDRACTLEHRLLGLGDRRVVARREQRLAPLGSCRTVFRLAELKELPAQLLVAVEPLPGANAKPMLRRVFRSGLHSMSHS